MQVISLDSPPPATVRSPAGRNPPPPGEESEPQNTSRWLSQGAQQLPVDKNTSEIQIVGSVPERGKKPSTPVLLSKVSTPTAENASSKLEIPLEFEIPIAKVEKRLGSPTQPAVQLPPALLSSEDTAASTSKQTDENAKFNVIHFDPELHWCRVCNVFPRTAKEFLNHLHAPEHKQNLSVSVLQVNTKNIA
ncbi:hypothetical protein J6590_016848 [Homalodisca vitripennis]|nr:hypothetical protein J6590_016848 [Homalodisca vitripennis]